MIIPPNNPTTTLFCNGEPCINNGTFYNNIEINCSGSTDAESDAITYFIEGYYNSNDSEKFINDNFEDGIINTSFWYNYTTCSIYGCDVRELVEIPASDGYLSLHTNVSISSATRGSMVAVRTQTNFNDSQNHIVNFTWQCDKMGLNLNL